MASENIEQKLPPWETDEYRAKQELVRERWSKHRDRANTLGFVAFFAVQCVGIFATNDSFLGAAFVGVPVGLAVRWFWANFLPPPNYECHFCRSKVKPATKVCPTCSKDIEPYTPNS